MSGGRMFRVSVEYEWDAMTVDELWPNGDAPDNPTVEDVELMIQNECGGPNGIVRDWFATPRLIVT